MEARDKIIISKKRLEVKVLPEFHQAFSKSKSVSRKLKVIKI